MSDSNAGMREALREAYKEGDIDLEEYLMEMKKLRAQQSVEAGEEAAAAAESEEEEDDVLLVDEDGGLFADGDAQQQGSSELSPGSAGRSPLARASEPEESADEEEDLVDLGSDDEDGEDGEDGQGAPSPQQTQAPEQQLRAGVLAECSEKGGIVVSVVRLGAAADYFNANRVYVTWTALKRGCKRANATYHGWVTRESLRVCPEAAEALREEPRAEALREELRDDGVSSRLGSKRVWGAADVGFGRLHCGGAYASLQQASNWLRSVGSGVLYSPGIWPLYDILLLQLRNIFSHPRFVNWNIPIFHRNSTGIFQYSTGIPLEYSNIPLEYSMESHIPLEYLVEF